MIAPDRFPSRVLMTADAVGGVWSYAVELIRALHPFGVGVLLAVMGLSPTRAQVAEINALPNAELRAAPFALEWMPAPWAEVDAAGDWMLELANLWRPDAIHLNGYAHAALPWPAPVLVVAHSCVPSWWRAVKGTALPGEWREYRRRMAAGLAAARLIAAPTRAMLGALWAEQQLPDEVLARGVVIPNGRDPARFRPATKEPIVLAAGRAWDEAKNLELLDAVAPWLDWPVVILGDNDARPGAAAFEHAHALGRATPGETAVWMSRAAIFASPARYEPFGLAVLEAALSGCALVLADIPSFRELWAGAAVFVPPHQPGAWTAVLRELTSDPARCSALGESARARALLYPPEHTAALTLRAYQCLRAPRPAEFLSLAA